MNASDDLLNDGSALVEDGCELLAQLRSAVCFLRRGAVPGLTVWDAIEQSLRDQAGTGLEWDETDPFRAVVRAVVADEGATMAHLLAGAIRGWLAATSQTFNDGVDW